MITRLLADGTRNAYAITRGEVCETRATSADAVRHIGAIAGFYATLGMDDQCMGLSAIMRRRYADLLATYAPKLEATNEFENALLAEAPKWREWLRESKRLDCDVNERTESLNALWTLADTLKPADHADINRQFEIAWERHRLYDLYRAELRWQRKSQLCPMPGMAALLAKFGNGHVVERQVSREIGPVKTGRIRNEPPQLGEAIDPAHCQLWDLKVFGTMLETLMLYGTDVPQQTSAEFKAREVHPGILEYGLLGYLERCQRMPADQVAAVETQLQTAASRAPQGEPLTRLQQAFRNDVRNWNNAACEDWSTDDIKRLLDAIVK
jgi:hypothetical protein